MSTSITTTYHKQALGSMAIAFGGIWAAVLAISLLAPDLVSGSEQQHLPVAAFATWIWGMVASVAVFSFWVSPPLASDLGPLHRPFAVGVAAVWLVAAVVGVLGPELVTGSDPTRVPVAAILTPMAATAVTFVVRAAVAVVGRVIASP